MKHKLLYLCALFVGAGFLPLPAPASALSAEGARAETPADYAMRALGVRYRLGGSSARTGFDCSGLVTHAFAQAWGVTLPHNVQAQSRIGTPVKRSALQPGDLLFYNTRNRPYSHVGIYLGEGRFIHAPRPGKLVPHRTDKWQYLVSALNRTPISASVGLASIRQTFTERFFDDRSGIAYISFYVTAIGPTALNALLFFLILLLLGFYALLRRPAISYMEYVTKEEGKFKRRLVLSLTLVSSVIAFVFKVYG